MSNWLSQLYVRYRFVRFLRAIQQLFELPFFFRKTMRGTALYDKGYKQLETFLSDSDCDQIIAIFDKALNEKLPEDDTDAYIVSRKFSDRSAFDRNVYQLMNFQGIDPDFQTRYEDKILSLFKEELGLDLCIASYTVQLDLPDTLTKRPFHMDGFGVNYKLFVYLNDVLKMEDGPYTVIPGSHRMMGRKWVNLILNLFSGNSTSDDMRYLHDDCDAHSFLAPKGTAIMSCQSLAHKGWQHHSGTRRYVLVVYLRAAHRKGERFVLGRESVITEPIKPAELNASIGSKPPNSHASSAQLR